MINLQYPQTQKPKQTQKNYSFMGFFFVPFPSDNNNKIIKKFVQKPKKTKKQKNIYIWIEKRWWNQNIVQDWRRDLKGFGNENSREIARKQGEIGRERKLF